MPKTSSKSTSKASSRATTSVNQILVALIALFLLSLALMTFKYFLMKRSWNMYAVQTLHSSDDKRMMNSTEDASVIAMTVGQFPANAPLYTQSKELQAYVMSFSQKTHRDLVVMDQNKMILADTIPANVGKKFSEDKDNEVTKTIADGQERSFIETSSDYKYGLQQTVVPLKDAAGKTVGAIVMSSSPIFN
jgi:sensor histidine kinase regulating citrate/malate metabolism